MTIYKLTDGKWGDWAKVRRAAYHQYSSKLQTATTFEVLVYYGNKEIQLETSPGHTVTHHEPDGAVIECDKDGYFESERVPVGAFCPSLLRHTLNFTLTPDEFRAFVNLKFRVPKTDVQDHIFSALAKLREALERVESEEAPTREMCTCTGLDPYIKEGWAEDSRIMPDGTPHPLDVPQDTGDEQ